MTRRSNHLLEILKTLQNSLRRFIISFNPSLHGVDLPAMRKWLFVAVLIGAVSGVSAIVFYTALDWVGRVLLGGIAGYYAPAPGGEGDSSALSALRPWLIPLITTLGGLASGLIVFKLAPEAEGHGTDAAINSFHNKNGFIRRRVPLVKLLASAITIGSGGSAGREGPIALVGAGIGSFISDVLKLNSRERRLALAVGIGAGVGAMFKAPLGGAILSCEILYRRDFESDALLPSFVASIVGYSIFASWQGWGPIFSLGMELSFNHPSQLIGYALLGLICGWVGALYGSSFYWIRERFRALRLPAYLKPALGGLLVGLMALWLPQVLGMGYGWIQLAINGNTAALPVAVMFGLILGKILATGLSVGSGGSGGVFAPGLMVGAMTGGALWPVLSRIDGIVPATPGPFVVIGMMTLFGGIAKAPLAIMIMVSEMTGGYGLLVPCMISVFIAYFITGRTYIYESQVPSRQDSPAHQADYSSPLLQKIKVKDVMHTDFLTTLPGASLNELSALMKANRIDGVPVVEDGKLVGIITALDIARVPEADWNSTLVAEVMTSKMILGYAGQTAYQAWEAMTVNNISHLPVVDRKHPERLVGMMDIRDIALCYRIALPLPLPAAG
jgi:chloride channel protein, CIC family